MAIDFFEIGKAGASRTKRIDYSKALDPLAKKVQTRVAQSKAKTEALINSMPQGVAIDKVPEELRGQVTDFLTKNKQEYVNASRVIASGIRPTDQRYIDAMATLNGVNSKFQNLSNQLEDIALKRQSSLDNRDHSPGALRWEIGDHEDLANGDMYSRFTLQDDGSFNYLSNDGKTKKWNDYSNTFQKSGVGQEAFTIMGQQAQQDGAYGNDFNEDKYKNLFRDLRQKLKTDGSRDFLFADETFLLKQTGLEEKDLGSDKYKNAVNKLVNEGNFEELMDKYQVHALEILEELHGGAIKSYNARQSSGGKDQTVLVDGKYMSRNDALNQANTMNTTGSITYSQTNPPIKYENIGNGRTRVYTRKEGTTSNEFIARRVITTEEAIAQRGLNVFNIEIEKYDVQKDQQFLKGQNILDAALKNLPVGTNSVLKKEEE
jgi:hypothetical protein